MSDHGIADLFEEVVDLHGDREAVNDRGRPITYAELDRRADRVAGWLAAHDIALGRRVGLALYDHPAHLEVLLGCFKAGVVPVNVNHRYTAGEIRGVLDDAQVAAVVHEPEVRTVILEASAGRDWILLEAGDDYAAALAGVEPAPRRQARSGDEDYLIYTGGTTGQPKGVLWAQADLVEAVRLLVNRYSATRMLAACPMIHGTAQWSALAVLLCGGTVVFGDPIRQDPEAIWDLVESQRVTRLTVVGDAVAAPLLQRLDDEPERWDLSSLVVISSGGARLSPSVRDGLLGHLDHLAIVNSYGTSESGGHGAQITFAGQRSPAEEGLLSFAIGTSTAVVGPDNRPLKPGTGEIGRIARRGAIPRGYLNDPVATAATFPVVDGERWVIPGDLATLTADGHVVVLGRDRNIINTGGEKVFAENVEQVLVDHPAVADAVVGGVADDRWGERVTALVALRRGATVDIDELVAHCRDHLAGYKVPRSITIVDEIRRHHTGKLNRDWAATTMSQSAH